MNGKELNIGKRARYTAHHWSTENYPGVHGDRWKGRRRGRQKGQKKYKEGRSKGMKEGEKDRKRQRASGKN